MLCKLIVLAALPVRARSQLAQRTRALHTPGSDSFENKILEDEVKDEGELASVSMSLDFMPDREAFVEADGKASKTKGAKEPGTSKASKKNGFGGTYGGSRLCCSWDGGKTCGGDSWCNQMKTNCDQCGGGTWYGCNGCSWDGGKTCGDDPWCDGSQNNCEQVCKGTWYGGGGDGPSPSPPYGQTATTTRYWDCSGGACACSYVPSALGGDNPVHCPSNAMFPAPAGNPHGAKFYGAAAISAALGGGDWLAPSCGKCWKVTGTSMTGESTTLVLKGTNFCTDGNPLCKAGPHFDIAAPGFDYAGASISNTCHQRLPGEINGLTACGNWPNTPYCNCDAFGDETLKAGCKNFLSLKWNNPTVSYVEVDCPSELSSLWCRPPPYATDNPMPATCAKNVF